MAMSLTSTATLGSRICSQLLGAHAMSACDTVSSPYRKGKASVVKTLEAGDFRGWFVVLGENSATDLELTAVGQQFFAALYGQPTGTSLSQARYNLYRRKRGKPVHIRSMPPTTNGEKCLLSCATCPPAHPAFKGFIKVHQLSPSQTIVWK
jgi:hypothetical protein